MFVSLIKEINMLIRKEMSNIYNWEKLTFSKLRFSLKENLKKCISFEDQKGIRYIKVTSSAVFRLQTSASDFF